MARISYAAVAQDIVTYSYRLDSDAALNTSELVEFSCDQTIIDHILADEAKADVRLNQVDAALQRLFSFYETRRLTCPLEPSSTPREYRPGLRPSAAHTTEEADRLRRLSMVVAFREALYALTPRQFEIVCGRLLEVIGCTRITVSRESKDDGVDAIAALSMAGVLERGTPLHQIAGGISFVVFLQAKRHGANTPSGGPEVQAVEGAWEWTRKAYADGTLSNETAQALQQADFRSADPVLLILATTSRFTPDGLAKAMDLGMIALDGEQLAQLLLGAGQGVKEEERGSYILDLGSLH